MLTPVGWCRIVVLSVLGPAATRGGGPGAAGPRERHARAMLDGFALADRRAGLSGAGGGHNAFSLAFGGLDGRPVALPLPEHHGKRVAGCEQIP